jgi:hypothetical protein
VLFAEEEEQSKVEPVLRLIKLIAVAFADHTLMLRPTAERKEE